MALSILLVTGQSGSGKSTAVRALEDQGYFCIDNLPVALVKDLIRVLDSEASVMRLALVMDVRERKFLSEGPEVVAELRQSGADVRVIYLDAKEEAVIRRYSETRRRHPLDDGCGLLEAIEREREILSPLRELADETIDTSAMSPHELRARVIAGLSGAADADALRVTLMSFGFKHGVPLEADMVLDVRFLPNPYFEPRLRERTGLDDEVAAFALGAVAAAEFLALAEGFLSFLIPQYRREGKRYLTVAIGCTGGRHRSVAVAEALRRRLVTEVPVATKHRDI